MVPRVYTTINTTNWMAGFNLLHQKSKTLPSEALAKSVGFVVDAAKRATPYTTISRIDTELQVVVVPVLSTRGKNKGKPLKSGESDVYSNPTDLASRIVLARMHPNSRYNRLTSSRWALNKPGTHGVAAFWGWVAASVERMVKGKHSSIKFLMQSWNPILAQIANLVPPNFKTKFMLAAGKNPNTDLGNAWMTGRGSLTPTLTIENRLGMDGRWPMLDMKRNEAAHRILGPKLQEAINANFEEQMKLAYEGGLLEDAAKLKAFGFEVR